MIHPRKKRLADGIIKNFSPKTQERIIFHLNNPSKLYLFLIAFGFLCFFHSLFSYYTLFSFSLAMISIFLLIKTCIKQIHEKGLINFLPLKFQNFLLDRSLFDVLCDLWFIPKIGLYLKAFFGPFYYDYTPEKALSNFEVIGMTRAVTVKGFLNLFPGLKKVILPPNGPKSPLRKPKQHNAANGNHNVIGSQNEGDTSSPSTSEASFVAEEEEKKDDFNEISMSEAQGGEPKPNNMQFLPNEQNKTQNIQIINNSNFVNVQSTVIFRSETFKSENVPMIVKGEERSKANNEKNKILNSKKNRKRSPFSNGIISKHQKNLFIDEVLEKDGITPSPTGLNLEMEKSSFEVNKFKSSVPKKKVEHFGIIRGEDNLDAMPKTKVISSCKKSEKEALENIRRASLILDEGVLITNSWDNQKKYDLKKLEEKKKIEDGDEEVQQVKGMFNIVNMLNEIKKNGILSKVNDKILMKLLGLSSIGLLLQLRYNKKARDWIVNSFMYMGFSMVFVLFGSSLALIVVKNFKSKGKKGKNLTKSEQNIVEKP